MICLAGIWYFDLWHDAMITLTMTLVATVLVMILALVFGVWMARDRRVDLGHPAAAGRRPDDPAVRLPDPGAGPLRARRGSPRSWRASSTPRRPPSSWWPTASRPSRRPRSRRRRSTGQTAWQEITKVQLPMAKGSLVLATNQGLLYVLAMTVIGGLVGAGALGYDVVLRLRPQRGVGQGPGRGHHHRPARRHARPDHPRRRRSTPRRRAGIPPRLPHPAPDRPAAVSRPRSRTSVSDHQPNTCPTPRR